MPMKTNPTKRELVIAAAAHAVIKAYNLSRAEVWPQPPWETLDDDLKDSGIIGVRHALANPGVSHREMWEKWKATRMAQGWTYGPTLNRHGKEHPNLVDDYTRLPVEERRKDELFLETVRLINDIIGPQGVPI